MNHHPVFTIEHTDTDIFVTADGVRIAKRGHPKSPQAKTWVTLVPGWKVTFNDDYSEIAIEFDGVPRH